MLKFSKILRSKPVILFPGQGTQVVGKMITPEHRKLNNYQEIMDTAFKILAFDIEKLMCQGPTEQLNSTKYAQPAIFVSSILSYLANKPADLKPSNAIFAGYSLGEITALVASERLSFEDALALIHYRAKYMQICCNESKTKLATILNFYQKHDSISNFLYIFF